MSNNRFELRIFRYDPFRDSKPTYKNYEISFAGSMSLLMALEYIYENMDETLAFRSYCCGTSRCNFCLMRANGKNLKACSTLLGSDKIVLVEPLEGYKLVKDLVVDFGTGKDSSLMEGQEDV